MTDPVIEVDQLGKRYRLGAAAASYGTLRDALGSAMRRDRGGDPGREIWALRDVSLQVGRGEALGIVGSNGAGKTTLLRILARITSPTTGCTRTRGRVGALLELGTGFHPELTGRDNVYLSGAIMGMTRADIRRRFDDIVDFSGVAPFIETPLKRYSSGMRLRLAFAVAAYLEPEILLVDEVLAVGDFDFQRRCIDRMATLSHEGRTVIFVSHDLGAITRLCTRAAWIDHGSVQRIGEAPAVVEAYLGSIPDSTTRVELPVEGAVGIRSVGLAGTDPERPATVRRGEPLTVELEVVAGTRVPALDLAISLNAADGTRILDEAWSDREDLAELTPEPGVWRVRLATPPLLRAGDYVVNVWLGTETHTYMDREILRFHLPPAPGDRQEWSTRPRSVQPPVTWSAQRVEG